MRTPEQVKQARIDLEYRRRQNAEIEIRDANFAAQLEEFQRETDRLERQADISDDEYRTLTANHDFRFNMIALSVAFSLICAILIISKYCFSQ